MGKLYENSDYLKTPVDCFIFDPSKEPFPVKPHWHYFAEILLMLDGKAEMHADEHEYLLGKGDLIIFHPSAVHSIYPAEHTNPRFIGIKFDINRLSLTPDYAPKFRSIFRYARKTGMRSVFRKEESEKFGFDKDLFSCLEEYDRHEYGYDLMIQSLLYTMLMKIVRSWLSENRNFDMRNIQPDESLWIENITAHIDSSLGNDLKVADIAQKCNMSYSSFAKRFHELYGMSCKEYIERMRIYKVEEYLLFTSYDLNYISQETGFSDCSHLIKSFRKYKGVTPKQFRKNRS